MRKRPHSGNFGAESDRLIHAVWRSNARTTSSSWHNWLLENVLEKTWRNAGPEARVAFRHALRRENAPSTADKA